MMRSRRRKPDHDIDTLLRSGQFEPKADFQETLWARLRQAQPQDAPLDNGSRHRASIEPKRDQQPFAAEPSATNSRLIPALALGLTAALAAALFWIILTPSREPDPLPGGPLTNTPALTPTWRPSTADPNARPSLSFVEDELEVEGCEPSFAVSGELNNTGDSPDDYAANVEIGYRIIRGDDYVRAVDLEPESWIRIEPGERVPYTVRVTLDSDLWSTASKPNQVKLRIFITAETNRGADAYRTRATVTLVRHCSQD